MPIELNIIQNQAASQGAASFWVQVKENPLLTLVLVVSGILIGLFLGFLYSFVKSNFSKTEADRKFNRILANFEQEKDTSETILRELEVGILAYGGDGKLITVNPSANAILMMEKVPQTLQGFLAQIGSDNGIQAALVLQTPNITGIVSINERTVRLRLTQTQLAPYHKPGWIIIIQDITEQEREEKQRKEFVANVSHELKTPLTTISAYSETLLDWGLEGKSMTDVRSDIVRIHDDANRMDNLVQNLLLLSSIDSRGIRAKMSQYDIVSVMRQVVSRMQVHAVEKQIQLESFVLSIIPPVYGDPSALDRILTNLVSNGIKYTDHRGFVSVSIQLTNDYISIKVTDNGMGVAKDNLQRLFDRFYRVDSTGSRKYGGTGLGLSIAKELTEIQGGTINVASVLGKGTEFVVTIPKAEKTYRETLAAIHADVPRHETVYENAEIYLLSAAEEIDIPIHELSELEEDQIEDLLSYLLTMPKEDKDYSIAAPSDLLPARFEAANKARISKEKHAADLSTADDSAAKKPSSAVSGKPHSTPGSHNTHTVPAAASGAAEKNKTHNSKHDSEKHDAKKPDREKSDAEKPVSRSAVRRAALESAGEHPAVKEPGQSASEGGKLVRPQAVKVSKSKPQDHPDDLKIITIDQLQSEHLKGEYHA